MRRLAMLALCPVMAVAAFASHLKAQGNPNIKPPCVCPPGPSPCTVTPNAGSDTVPANGALDSVVFTVKNTGGTYTDTYSLTMTCTSITCTRTGNPSPTLLTLSPGNSGMAWVKFYHPSSPGSGSVALTATDTISGDFQATGTWNIITTPPSGPPTIALQNFNGVDQDRGLCLTFGAGQAAGLSCGDLFVTHAMPAYRTMNRDRQLTLFYSSAAAAPRPTVAAWVTQPQSQQAPTSVIARLLVNGVVRDSASFSSWSAGATRQVVLAWITDTASGLYPFTLAVRNIYPSGSYETTVSDTLMVVNRAHSEFGAGWWLDGVEQLVFGQPGSRILWLGGDGSAAAYDPAGTNTWVRAAGPYRDTLLYSSSAHKYTRTLRHGIQVTYDTTGHHLTTVNRAQNTTTFTWTGATTRLTSIKVPPGVTGTTYTLAYNAANNLHSITDPGGRVLRDTVSSSNLTQIFDPDYVAAPVDSHTVHFGYDAAHRMTSRTGRRGFGTAYSYANGLHITRIAVPLRPAVHDTAVTALAWWDERGLAIGSPSGTQTPVDPLISYSRFDGPRTDVGDSARFWVDRWGAALQIVGPVHDTTLIARSTSTGLVSRMRDPVGNVWGILYNARGNPLTITDSTHEGQGGDSAATTTYSYHDSNDIDSPDSVIDPVGLTTRYSYNSLGIDSMVTAPNGQQSRYLYATGSLQGLLTSVTALQVRTTDSLFNTTNQDQTTALAYNSLGNQVSVTTPKGSVSHFGYNAYTQGVADTNAVGNVTLYYPRVMGVEDSIVQLGSGSDRRRTAFTYDADFDRLTLADPRNVMRFWGYDAASRDTSETDDYGETEHHWFGPSGLLDSVLTRLQVKVYRNYDAAGRLTRLAFPAVFADTAPGDTVTYAYDAAGRMITASNRTGRIARQYYREGTLKQDSAYSSLSYTYTGEQRYQYYRDDLRSRYTDFTVGGNDTISVGYKYNNGTLGQLVITYPGGTPGPDTATYTWDGLGRRQQLITPHHLTHATVNWYYDLDGRRRAVCELRHARSAVVHHTASGQRVQLGLQRV